MEHFKFCLKYQLSTEDFTYRQIGSFYVGLRLRRTFTSTYLVSLTLNIEENCSFFTNSKSVFIAKINLNVTAYIHFLHNCTSTLPTNA